MSRADSIAAGLITVNLTTDTAWDGIADYHFTDSTVVPADNLSVGGTDTDASIAADGYTFGD